MAVPAPNNRTHWINLNRVYKDQITSKTDSKYRNWELANHRYSAHINVYTSTQLS
jgi:hypothetical protein